MSSTHHTGCECVFCGDEPVLRAVRTPGADCRQCGHVRHIGRCHADVDQENRCTCDTFKGRPEENQFIGRQNYTLEALPTFRSKMWGER